MSAIDLTGLTDEELEEEERRLQGMIGIPEPIPDLREQPLAPLGEVGKIPWAGPSAAGPAAIGNASAGSLESLLGGAQPALPTKPEFNRGLLEKVAIALIVGQALRRKKPQPITQLAAGYLGGVGQAREQARGEYRQERERVRGQREKRQERSYDIYGVAQGRVYAAEERQRKATALSSIGGAGQDTGAIISALVEAGLQVPESLTERIAGIEPPGVQQERMRQEGRRKDAQIITDTAAELYPGRPFTDLTLDEKSNVFLAAGKRGLSLEAADVMNYLSQGTFAGRETPAQAELRGQQAGLTKERAVSEEQLRGLRGDLLVSQATENLAQAQRATAGATRATAAATVGETKRLSDAQIRLRENTARKIVADYTKFLSPKWMVAPAGTVLLGEQKGEEGVYQLPNGRQVPGKKDQKTLKKMVFAREYDLATQAEREGRRADAVEAETFLRETSREATGKATVRFKFSSPKGKGKKLVAGPTAAGSISDLAAKYQ